VASDGGVFTFGDARFYGSTGDVRLNKPIVGMASTPSGNGYWLVASDGGIFTFGNAAFHGSTGNVNLVAPIVGMATDQQTGGYWLAAADGGLFTFDAPFLGSAGAQAIRAPIIAMLSTEHGFPFPPGTTGYDVWAGDCPPPAGHGLPGGSKGFAVVQIAGNTDGYMNPCYSTEARWAGSNMAAYVYMTGLPGLRNPQAMSGPAGTCSATNAGCQSWNYGYYWARRWVAISRSVGVYPNLWLLDVEVDPSWRTLPTVANADVISGAVVGLRSAGAIPGIYSTPSQWTTIVGNLRFPGIALWIPGAGNVATSAGNIPSALQICSGAAALYEPFAGGVTVLVQTGWFTSPYPGAYLTDYSCR
jgi:hypothetical protein